MGWEVQRGRKRWLKRWEFLEGMGVGELGEVGREVVFEEGEVLNGENDRLLRLKKSERDSRTVGTRRRFGKKLHHSESSNPLVSLRVRVDRSIPERGEVKREEKRSWSTSMQEEVETKRSVSVVSASS